MTLSIFCVPSDLCDVPVCTARTQPAVDQLVKVLYDVVRAGFLVHQAVGNQFIKVSLNCTYRQGALISTLAPNLDTF